MTAVNLAIAEDRAFIACDESVSAAKRIKGATSKVHALPHLRMVVVGLGQLGLLSRWVEFLISESQLRDVADVDAVAPECLVKLHQLLRPSPSLDAGSPPISSIIHIGACGDDTIAAFHYSSSTGFSSEALKPSLYFMPELTLAPGDALAPGVVVARTDAPAIAPTALPWRKQVQACVDIMRVQHAERLAPIGGRIQCCELTPYAIHQFWLDDLGADPD